MKPEPDYKVSTNEDGKVVLLDDGVPIIEMLPATARQMACLLLKYSGAKVSIQGNTISAFCARASVEPLEIEKLN